MKLIKEPEAAALFTLHHMGDKGLAVGDAFVVCDAGGGTVDLISYEIISLKPFELKELAAAKGMRELSFQNYPAFLHIVHIILTETSWCRGSCRLAHAQPKV